MTKMEDFRRAHNLDIKQRDSIRYQGKLYKVVGNSGKNIKIKGLDNKIIFIDPKSEFELVRKFYFLSKDQLKAFATNIDDGWSLRKCLANAGINFIHQEKYERDNPEFRALLYIYYKKSNKIHPNAKRIIDEMEKK